MDTCRDCGGSILAGESSCCKCGAALPAPWADRPPSAWWEAVTEVVTEVLWAIIRVIMGAAGMAGFAAMGAGLALITGGLLGGGGDSCGELGCGVDLAVIIGIGLLVLGSISAAIGYVAVCDIPDLVGIAVGDLVGDPVLMVLSSFAIAALVPGQDWHYGHWMDSHPHVLIGLGLAWFFSLAYLGYRTAR